MGLPVSSFARRPWQTVSFHGVPMFRAHAWALDDYERHGGHLFVNSADRREGVAERFGKRSQAALYRGWQDAARRWGPAGAQAHGWYPANPPGFSSHELRSDGHPFYGPRGARVGRHKLGIDAVGSPGGDAAAIVSWLNAHGYSARRPYATTSERHHFSFAANPARHARRRKAQEVARAARRRARVRFRRH